MGFLCTVFLASLFAATAPAEPSSRTNPNEKGIVTDLWVLETTSELDGAGVRAGEPPMTLTVKGLGAWPLEIPANRGTSRVVHVAVDNPQLFKASDVRSLPINISTTSADAWLPEWVAVIVRLKTTDGTVNEFAIAGARWHKDEWLSAEDGDACGKAAPERRVPPLLPGGEPKIAEVHIFSLTGDGPNDGTTTDSLGVYVNNPGPGRQCAVTKAGHLPIGRGEVDHLSGKLQAPLLTLNDVVKGSWYVFNATADDWHPTALYLVAVSDSGDARGYVWSDIRDEVRFRTQNGETFEWNFLGQRRDTPLPKDQR